MAGCYSADLHSSSGAPILLLDNLRSAFNVGSAFRVAEAISPCHVFLTGCCARPGGRKLAHTARGTQNTVLWKYFESSADAAAWISGTGRRLVVLEPLPEAIPIFEAPFGISDAFVFGNEALGVSSGVLAAADMRVYMPQTGTRGCMNVAGAIAATAMEIQRRRLLLGLPMPPPVRLPWDEET